MMRRMPTNVSAAGTARIRRILRSLGLVSVLLLLFVAFEVGIRYVPPDGMTYTMYDTREFDSYGHAVAPTTRWHTLTFAAPHDQQVINTYLQTLNDRNGEQPSSWVSPAYSCGRTLSPDKYQFEFVFTWHGIPVQSWYDADCGFMQSSGGIPNIFVVHSIGLPLPPSHQA
jgi:hypothetical protein